jgi:hypothetical protein
MPSDDPTDAGHRAHRRHAADRVELSGRPPIARPLPISSPADSSTTEGQPRSRFLSIWYRCCHVYGRLYKNKAETHYEGQCPRCGASLEVPIGDGGTSRRMFEAG